MNIPTKKLDERAVVPTYGTKYAAGMDLYACLDADITINPGETSFVHTGIAMAIPEGYAGFLYARSGLSCKQGLAPANKVGVIDADYRGEIMVALHNHSNQPVTVKNQDRIAQLAIQPIMQADLTVLSATEFDNNYSSVRGEGGFGSTGK